MVVMAQPLIGFVSCNFFVVSLGLGLGTSGVFGGGALASVFF